MSEPATSYRRLVVKLGTNLLTAGSDRLDLEVMAALVGQIARLHQQGHEVIIVSSGAIAAGRQKLGLAKERKDIPFKQVMAAVGQNALMHSYGYYIFGRYKYVSRCTIGNVREKELLELWTCEEYVKFRSKVRAFAFPSCVDCGIDCGYTNVNRDCWGADPSCADCLYAQGIIKCP